MRRHGCISESKIQEISHDYIESIETYECSTLKFDINCIQATIHGLADDSAINHKIPYDVNMMRKTTIR